MNLLIRAIREEIHASGCNGNPAQDLINESLKRIADRYEQLLDERAIKRAARAEQRDKEERDLYNDVMGHGQH